MLGFDTTDWNLSALTPRMAGVNVVARVGTGLVHMEFTNKSTGAVVPIDGWGATAALAAPVWSTITRPWVTVTKGEVWTTPSSHSPFDIVQVRNNYGFIYAIDWASALGVLAFSYIPVPPPSLLLSPAIFAGCFFALPTTLASSLSVGPFVLGKIS